MDMLRKINFNLSTLIELNRKDIQSNLKELERIEVKLEEKRIKELVATASIS